MIFNGACPICSREIAAYQRYCAARDLTVRFKDLNALDLAPYGITAENARRRLHVLHRGRIVAGLPAFLILWEAMPRFRPLARLLGLPVIQPVAAAVHDRALAPLLYAFDRRRRRRIACSTGAR